MTATAEIRSDGRVRRAQGDATGKVRIVVQLVGVRHRLVKGNMTRVITREGLRVSDVGVAIDGLVAALLPRTSTTRNVVVRRVRKT
jgi:hypothetical protein